MAAQHKARVSGTLGKYAVVAIAIALVLIAAWLQYLLFDPKDFDDFSILITLATLALLIGADRMRIGVPFGRQRVSFNLTFVPLTIGVFYLPVSVVLVIVILGIVAKYITYLRRIVPAKMYFNIGSGLFDGTLFVFVFNEFNQADITNPTSWIAIISASTIPTFFGLGFLLLLVWILEGEIERPVLKRSLVAATLVSILPAILTLPILLSLETTSLALIPLVAMGALIVIGYMRYDVNTRRLHTMEDLFGITESISSVTKERHIADTMLEKARVMLKCETSTLWLPPRGIYPEVCILAQHGQRGVVDDPIGGDAIRQHVIETGQTVIASTQETKLPRPEPRIWETFLARKCKDIIVVALHSGNAVVGCIEVTGRLGELVTFDESDQRLLEILAAHVGLMLENMRLVERLEHDAYHDLLTGLTNRRGFIEALEKSIHIQQRPSEVVAIIQFDVKAMREKNENLGHQAGDQLIVEVGRRLAQNAPGGALVARLDGDTFAVLQRAPGSEAAQTYAQMLHQALTEPIRVDSQTIDVETAVGVALYPDHGRDATTLMQRADAATYAAKQQPRSVQLYRVSTEGR